MMRVSLAVLVALACNASVSAQNSTWNVNANGSWQNVANWSPAYVPNYFSDIANLGNIITANRTVTLDAPVELDRLNFTVNGSAGYILTSSAPANTLTLNSIYNGSFTSTATTNINLATNATGNLITGSSGNINVSNYSASGATLNFGSTTTLATPAGTGGISFSNYNNASNVINVNGNIGAPGKGFTNVTVGGDYTTTGTVVFRGDNSNSNASYGIFNGGHLVLDYTANNTNKVGSGSSFYIINSTLTMQGNAAGTTQTANGLGGYGQVTINVNSGAGGFTFSPGLLGLSDRGSINFATMPVTGSITASQSNTNGILQDDSRNIRGNVVIGSNTWATRSGSNLVGYTGYVSTFTAGSNTDVTTSVSPGAFTTNTLRFNTAAPITLSMTGTNSIVAGGILVTPNVGANTSTISGGVLTSAGHLNIIQHNTAAPLSIQSSISLTGTSNSLVKTGPGTLTLDGTVANSSLNRVDVYSGTLNLSKPSGTSAIGGSLTVRGGTVNIATNNLPSTTSIYLDNGQINFLGPQTITSFNHNSGGFSNANLTFTGVGGGTLQLGGGNYNYAGTAYTFASPSGGNVYFTTNQPAFGGTISSNSGGTPVFNLGGVTRSFFFQGSNTLNGLHFGNGNVDFNGNGNVSFNGVETLAGNTTIRNGQYYFNNSYASPITVQPTSYAYIGGTGVITQTVTMTTANSNVIEPGPYYAYSGSASLSPGILTMGGLNTTGAQVGLWIDLMGATPGTQYDRLVVTGSALLGTNTRLYVVDLDYTAPLGTNFLVMTRGAGSSGFLVNPDTGLPFSEGEVFDSSYHPDVHYRFSYLGGDGNDISLTAVAVPEPATWAMIGLFCAGSGYFVYLKRRRAQQFQDMELINTLEA